MIHRNSVIKLSLKNRNSTQLIGETGKGMRRLMVRHISGNIIYKNMGPPKKASTLSNKLPKRVTTSIWTAKLEEFWTKSQVALQESTPTLTSSLLQMIHRPNHLLLLPSNLLKKRKIMVFYLETKPNRGVLTMEGAAHIRIVLKVNHFKKRKFCITATG